MPKKTIRTIALLVVLASGYRGWCEGFASLQVIRVDAMPLAVQDQQNPKNITVPAGTRILVRTAESIDSTTQSTGYPSECVSPNRSCPASTGWIPPVGGSAALWPRAKASNPAAGKPAAGSTQT